MYYLLVVQTMLDGTEAETVNSFDNKDEAEKQFHNQLAYDINNPLLKSVMCVVISENCNTLYSRYWVNNNIDYNE